MLCDAVPPTSIFGRSGGYRPDRGRSGRPAGYHPRTTSTLVSMRRVAKCARRFSDCTGLRRVRAADATGRRACEIVPRGAGFPSLHHRTVLPAQPRALPLHHLCYASCCTHHHPQHHHLRYQVSAHRSDDWLVRAMRTILPWDSERWAGGGLTLHCNSLSLPQAHAPSPLQRHSLGGANYGSRQIPTLSPRGSFAPRKRIHWPKGPNNTHELRISREYACPIIIIMPFLIMPFIIMN